MAHLFVPADPESSLPLWYNVDETVGAWPARNAEEDVWLVQFLLHAALTNSTLAESREVGKTVVLNGRCSPGDPADPTIAALRYVQRQLRTHGLTTVVDGRVSRARAYHFGGGYFTIVWLNEMVQRRHHALWPRIDRIPKAPDPVRKLVTRTVAGIP